MTIRRVALLVLAASCNGGDPVMDSGVAVQDASDVADASAPIVEIGIGQDDFSPLTDGANVTLAQGTQGGGRILGYHVWSAVRVRGFLPASASVEFVMLDSTGTEQARQPRTITLQPMGEFYGAYGFAPRIMDCCSVANQSATMRVRVEDTDGVMGMDERTVMVGPCLDNNTGFNQCP